MISHYIPEDQFPMPLSPRTQMVGNYFFNLFLIQGREKSALFETGVSGVVDSVIDQLRQLGVEPDYLIPSHPHSDHITGLPGLVEAFPRAQVLVAKGAKEFISHPKAGAALIAEDAFISKGLENQGLPPRRPPLTEIPRLETARIVSRPRTLDLGGLSLELIPVQGHSPGNLVARVPEENLVFCADSLGFHYPGRGVWPLYFTGAQAYLDTLEQLKKMDASILCPAHQGPIFGKEIPKILEMAIGETRQLIERIKATPLEKEEDLAQELFEESYRDEFTLYTQKNIMGCSKLLIKRGRQI